jgi:hypothetical protein
MAPQNDLQGVQRLIFDAAAAHALRQVLEVAGRKGVRIAPVKGIVLSRWLYERLEERPYRDVDLLIAREDHDGMMTAVQQQGWTMHHESAEMGQLEFIVDRVMVEVHSEFGRRDLSRLTTDQVLGRAQPDVGTFPFALLRLDDIDHFFLLVSNVTKKAFVYANRHQPADLERFAVRLEPRWHELVERAERAAFMTALRCVGAWMVEEHRSDTFARLLAILPPSSRVMVPAAIRFYRRHAARAPRRLESASGLVGLALATLTPDDRSLRLRGFARVVRRGVLRRLGRNPD